MAITYSRIKSALGSRLKDLRQQRRLTQEDLAEAIKICPESYGRIERGLSFPSIPTLIKLSEALGLSIESLLDLESEAEPAERIRPAIYRLADLIADLDARSQRQVLRAVRLMVKGVPQSDDPGH